MSIETLVLLVLVVFLVGIIPAWPYSKPWGYAPTGVLSLLLVIFLIWAIAGGRPLFRSTVAQDLTAAGRNVADSIRDTVQ
ncbi:MAG: DUF3309 domain-containing protein [Candidatus Omnitrophica bacterium]|nr:DUF3309 domain-containing protein [Candidatus Omnitrophota bacterium]